jgi:hypothetical protein
VVVHRSAGTVVVGDQGVIRCHPVFCEDSLPVTASPELAVYRARGDTMDFKRVQ